MSAEIPLSKIRVLFRESDTMALWGIPYEMRPGTAHKDIHGKWVGFRG